MEEKPENIGINNAAVQDIISKTPGWLTTWGTTLILGILLLIIAGASVFRFPDSVKTAVTITTENPPADLMAHASGNIKELFVVDNQDVSSGDILAIITNPAVYQDVKMIKSWTDGIHPEMDLNSLPFQLPDNDRPFQLGEIQPILSAYLNHLADYYQYRSDNPVRQQIAALKQELLRYQELGIELEKQHAIMTREMELVRKQHQRNIALHDVGSISDADLEKSESIKLAREFDRGQIRVTMADNRIQETRTRQEILTHESRLSGEIRTKELNCRESFMNLIAAIAAWENKYILASPVDGKVSFTRIWNENQPVTEGQLVMTVVPHNQGKIMGKVRLPMKGAGKVRTGQKVLIRLEHYPFMEFGMVSGEVESIAEAPAESVYLVQVNLPSGLKTSYGKTIAFHQEMQGLAEIVTEEMSLLTRIINPLRYIIRKTKE
jgi:HlyD family secretion protein